MTKEEREAQARADRREAERQTRLATGRPAARVAPATPSADDDD